MTSMLTFAATELAPGADKQFELLENLTPDDSEAGGFAKLLRTTLPDGTIVAVKRFHRHEGDGDAFALDGTSAAREFACLCELDSANGHAPRAFALGTCTDKQGLVHHAIAMEYIEGFTVEAALASGVLAGSLHSHDKTHTLLAVARHIVTAIAACDAHVVHRDISPANVILVMDAFGQVKRAVLIDWGQSVNAGSPFVTPALGEGRKLATVCFGAPCVFGGAYYEERNEPAVDVYSFGALLYYMRTRELPFAELADGSLMTPGHVENIAAAKQKPLSLAGRMPSMRPLERALDHLIGACTAFDPHERPSAAAIERAIRNALREGTKESAGVEAGASARAGAADTGTTSAGAAADVACAEAEAADDKDPFEKAAEEAGIPPFPSADDFAYAQNFVSDFPEFTDDKDNADSLFHRAIDCFYGHGGMERNPHMSAKLLERAAKAGSVEAMFTLGKNLKLGVGMRADAQRGAYWLKQARDHGHPGACALL